MDKKVFISHSSKDKLIADQICNTIENNGIGCWIAPRDIPYGNEWAGEITKALRQASICIFLFSKNSNQSKQVAKEIQIAIDNEVIIIPICVENVEMNDVLTYYLATMHWLLEYDEKTLLDRVEKALIAPEPEQHRQNADMQNFVLDFILPEIAWQMERNNKFYLRVREIRKIIELVLCETDDLSVCGEFGRELFSKYRNGASAKMHTYKVAKRIIERLRDDMTEVTESIINCCVFALGTMQESEGKYGFVHQHIRDYFAALKNINTIRLSVYLYEEDEKELALECMNKVFKDEPVNYTVRRFMGEYLGEHRNKPHYTNEVWNYSVPNINCDLNLINRCLNIYRGCFNGETGYGLFSLIEILKAIREDLSGSDFSNLDLSFNNFYNKTLSHENLKSNFNNCIVSGKNFLPIGHSSPISSICFNPNQTEMVSVDVAGKVCVWDTNGYIIKTIINTQVDAFRAKNHLVNAVFSNSGKRLVLTFNDGTIGIYETNNYTCLNTIKYENEEIALLTEIIFDFNDSYLAFVKGHQEVNLYDLNTYECIYQFSASIPIIAFSCNNHFVINYKNTDKQLCAVYNLKTKCLDTIENKAFDDNIKQMLFSPNGKDVCLVFEKEFIIFDYRLHNIVYRSEIKKYGKAEYVANGDILKISSSLSGYISIYETEYFSNIQTFHCNWYEAQAYSPSNIYCYGDQQGIIKVYNSNTMNLVNKLYGNNDSASIGKFSKDESLIVVGFMDGNIHVWDVSTDNDWELKELIHKKIWIITRVKLIQ